MQQLTPDQAARLWRWIDQPDDGTPDTGCLENRSISAARPTTPTPDPSRHAKQSGPMPPELGKDQRGV